MLQLNMKQASKALKVGYEPFRKYVIAIRERYPNYAKGGIMGVMELGYMVIFLDEFYTTNAQNRTNAAVEAVDTAIRNNNKPFIR